MKRFQDKPLLRVDAGTRVLCWCHDRSKVYRCTVVWQFSHGGELLPYGVCRDYWFMLRAHEEGIFWSRGGWTRTNVDALLAVVTMDDNYKGRVLSEFKAEPA